VEFRTVRRDSGRQTPFWLIEGFTDYYARALLQRAGLITMNEYVEDIKQLLSPLSNFSRRVRKGSIGSRAVYVDADLQKLAYQRGGLLAATWDSRIRRRAKASNLSMTPC